MQFHSPRCYCAHVNNDWMTKLAAASPEKKLRVSYVCICISAYHMYQFIPHR